MKQLRKEGFENRPYRLRGLMKKLGLVVKRKKRLVLTTNSNHNEPVADNLLNREFATAARNQTRTTDITYNVDCRVGSIWRWRWICIRVGPADGKHGGPRGP